MSKPKEDQRKIAWALGLDPEKLADQVALNQREPRERGEYVTLSTRDLAQRSVVFNSQFPMSLDGQSCQQPYELS
jgi:hypothetical protein